MIVGGDLGDGFLLLDLGIFFGLARGDLIWSGLLAGRFGSDHRFAFARGNPFADDIVHVVHTSIGGEQSLWVDLFEGFVQFGQVLHVVSDELESVWKFVILSFLDLVQKGRHVLLDKSQGLPLKFFVEECRRFEFRIFCHV